MNDAGAPAPAEPSEGSTLTARLSKPLADAPAEGWRAALVWVDREEAECQPGACPPLKQHVTVRSDVAVPVTTGPLTIRLPIELTEPYTMTFSYTLEEDGPVRIVKSLHSMPQAEVVLYADGNANGRLDLLAPGEPGPGPDRILALASGRNRQGNAVRTVLVNRRSPAAPSGVLQHPALSLLADSPYEGGEPQDVYPDGVYVVELTASITQPVLQQVLLSNHGEMPSSYRSDDTLFGELLAHVRPLEDAIVELLPVDRERRSWLSRGCALHPLEASREELAPPPAGSDIQCGAGFLMYATSPDDYCGQTGRMAANYAGDWWPCDEHGLKAGTPYRAATQRFDVDVRDRDHTSALTGNSHAELPSEWSCQRGVIYDVDASPAYHLPTVAPSSGSQVMCYGADSFSYIEPRSDGCSFKLTYDLASDVYRDWTGFYPGWDWRAARPEWWPCDAQGELRSDSPYVSPEPLEPAFCTESAIAPLPAPLPAHTKVYCESAESIKLLPKWRDGCDGLTEFMINGSVSIGGNMFTWSGPKPENWPCDEAGNFRSESGYETF
jgi:hypothetical protein